jgi:hypothetical protein
MAAVSVAFDGTRLTNADSSSGFTAEGATPTNETDYYYQGSGSVSIQVKTAEVGTYYTGTTANYTTGNYVWIAKIIQTNKDAIDGSGLQLKIGSANSASYLYYIYPTAADYPAVGGWQVICINPNIAQWRGTTIGSPSLTGVTTYGIRSDAAFQAKAPNLGIDAVDYIATGSGLTLTRGDSTDANGDFDDFVTFDEGTQDNRYAVVQTRGGIIYVNATLQIGNSSVNTEFTDMNKVLVFPDHRVSNGFCGVKFNISNTGSGVGIYSSVFNGRGSLYTSDDTRPDYTVTGNSGQMVLDGCTFNVFRYMNLTSTVVVSGSSLLSGQTVFQNSSNLYSCIIDGAATANAEAFIRSDNVSRISYCDFTFSSNGGHAIEITTTGTYSLVENVFTGFGANGTGNAAIYNNSGGLVTLNLSGDSIPTIRNGTSATTNVVASATITLNGIVTNSEVKIYNYLSEGYEHAGGYLAGNNGTHGYVQTATVSDGGSAYTNDDVLTVSGGTGTAATLTVQTNGSGVVTSAAVTTNGDYTVNPTNPVSTTGGTGSGAKFNLDISGSFSYAYDSGSGLVVDIIIHHLDYKTERYQAYSLPTTDSSLLVRQIADRTYYNP